MQPHYISIQFQRAVEVTVSRAACAQQHACTAAPALAAGRCPCWARCGRLAAPHPSPPPAWAPCRSCRCSWTTRATSPTRRRSWWSGREPATRTSRWDCGCWRLLHPQPLCCPRPHKPKPHATGCQRRLTCRSTNHLLPCVAGAENDRAQGAAGVDQRPCEPGRGRRLSAHRHGRAPAASEGVLRANCRPVQPSERPGQPCAAGAGAWRCTWAASMLVARAGGGGGARPNLAVLSTCALTCPAASQLACNACSLAHICPRRYLARGRRRPKPLATPWSSRASSSAAI